MKRRYSPQACRAHLRAMHNKPRVAYVQEVTPVGKLIESYQLGFLTAVELADLILQTLPQPEPALLPVSDHTTAIAFPAPAPQPEPHSDDCQCHLCWAASLTPPSPPWEGGIA